MTELVCDACGTVNRTKTDVCELCGDCLQDEVEAAQRRSLLVHLPMTLVLTLAIVVLPGYIIYIGLKARFWLSGFEGITPGVFWFVYLALWALALMLGSRYEPRSDYDFGKRRGYTTFRQSGDRMHAGLGLALLPVNLVREYWMDVYRTLRGTEPRKKPTSSRWR